MTYRRLPTWAPASAGERQGRWILWPALPYGTTLELDDIGLTQPVIASIAKQFSAGSGRPGLLRSAPNDEHPVQPDVIRP